VQKSKKHYSRRLVFGAFACGPALLSTIIGIHFFREEPFVLYVVLPLCIGYFTMFLTYIIEFLFLKIQIAQRRLDELEPKP
jgi:hypothetical protein